MRVWIKQAAKAALFVPVWVLRGLYHMRLLSYETGSCGLALVPGPVGIWLRRCWYKSTLLRCGSSLCVNWMAFISRPETGVGNSVYIGPFSSVMNADIGDDVMLGTHVCVARGAHQHGMNRTDVPMTRQTGQPRQIKIGNDVWVGTSAVILADVAEESVVGAGAVVTNTFETHSVLVGVPARPIRRRGALAAPNTD